MRNDPKTPRRGSSGLGDHIPNFWLGFCRVVLGWPFTFLDLRSPVPEKQRA